MDWSRAKTYLILTFLLLDFVLGYQYWKMRNEQASYVQSYTEQLTEVRALLASQNWDLRTDVPKTTMELGFLQVRYPQTSQEEWKKRIAANDALYFKGPGQINVDMGEKNLTVPINDANIADKTLLQMAPHIWPEEKYKFDRKIQDSKDSGILYYLQEYNGLPIFSAPLEMIIGQDKIQRYQQTMLEVVGEGGGKKQIISALHALRSLSESIDKSGKSADNRIIQEIRIGYYSKSFNADEWYLIPVWRILSDREVYYVNAITGEVEVVR